MLRRFGLSVLSLLAVLTGCSPPVIAPLYGPAPVVHDPTVAVTDFSYEPASPIQVGDTLRFTATTNRPFSGWEGEIRVLIGSKPTSPLNEPESFAVEVQLNDYGLEADQVGSDGLWTGELTWAVDYGSRQDLPVAAHLEWADGYVAAPVLAAPLTVLPAVD
jgi:hypothetical protein